MGEDAVFGALASEKAGDDGNFVDEYGAGAEVGESVKFVCKLGRRGGRQTAACRKGCSVRSAKFRLAKFRSVKSFRLRTCNWERNQTACIVKQ